MLEKEFPKLRSDLYRIYLMGINANKAKPFQTLHCNISKVEFMMLVAALCLNHEFSVGPKESSITYILDYLNTGVISSKVGNIPDVYSFYYLSECKEGMRAFVTRTMEDSNKRLKKLSLSYQKISSEREGNLITLYSLFAKYYIFLEEYARGNAWMEKEIWKVQQDIEKCIDDMNWDHEDKLTIWKNHYFNSNWKKEFIEQKGDFWQDRWSQLAKVVLQLRSVKRFSQAIDIVEENVLVHTWELILITDAMVRFLQEQGEEVDRNQVFLRVFYHDFGESSGNDIISDVKVFSDFTKAYFDTLVSEDEKRLKGQIGESAYQWMSLYKKGASGYIADILDKLVGLMKVYIEIHFFNNINFLSVLKTNYFERLIKFLDISRIKNFQHPLFLKELMDYMYITNQEEILSLYGDTLSYYYSNEEVEEMYQVLDRIHKDNNRDLGM